MGSQLVGSGPPSSAAYVLNGAVPSSLPNAVGIGDLFYQNTATIPTGASGASISDLAGLAQYAGKHVSVTLVSAVGALALTPFVMSGVCDGTTIDVTMIGLTGAPVLAASDILISVGVSAV